MLKYQYLTRYLYSIYPAAFYPAAYLVILHHTLPTAKRRIVSSWPAIRVTHTHTRIYKKLAFLTPQLPKTSQSIHLQHIKRGS